MPRQRAPAEFNTFVAGLSTDFSPLTFPENASIDEENFVLNRDGGRRRRLGMDYEEDYSEITTTTASSTQVIASQSYVWENAGGDPDIDLLVVQLGNEIKFFDLANDTISSTVIATHHFTSADNDERFSFSVVDGILICATGEATISLFEYDSSGPSISQSTDTLLVRDFWGVEDLDGATDLRLGNNIQNRPTTLTDEHLYNLRNQGYGVERPTSSSGTPGDPIAVYNSAASNYPANSDTIADFIYPNATQVKDRFQEADMEDNAAGTFESPLGYFIIDALARGTSRETEMTANDTRYSGLTLSLSGSGVLPDDTTSGGARVVGAYAGRSWFGGFDGTITDGDSHSPLLASYVFFSQLVDDIADIAKCYQQADPTSYKDPDIAATDGGVVRIAGCYGVKAFVTVGDSIFVLAKAGVWRISGGSDYGFSADEYFVEKISNHGIIGKNTVVEVDKDFMYWSDDGIYHVHTNQFGDWVSDNIVKSRVQNFYDTITQESKTRAEGAYDHVNRRVRWIYDTLFSTGVDNKELVLDLNLGAYYKNRIISLDTNSPFVVSVFSHIRSNTAEVTNQVTQGGGTDDIIISPDTVTVTQETDGISEHQVYYVCVTDTSSVYSYTFSQYTNTEFLDWYTEDSTGKDAAAFVVTGYTSAGDFMRRKQLSYLVSHFNRTENGTEDDGGTLIATNQSGCLLQAQWAWANTDTGKRWSTARQSYRYPRIYTPADVNDTWDTGYSVVSSKLRIRGQGEVVSFKWSTQPGKDCQLNGWSIIAAVNGNL